MHVRGLCSDSLYDRKYFYNIGEDGRIMFLGEEESMIRFDEENSVWIWTDRNFPNSKGSEFSTIKF